MTEEREEHEEITRQVAASASGLLEVIEMTLGNMQNDIVLGISHKLEALSSAAETYKEAVYYARSNGLTSPAFSSSNSHKLIDELTIQLKSASQQLGGIASDLRRFAP